LPFSDPERHLRDILESIEPVSEFIRDMDFVSYQRDNKNAGRGRTQKAVIRLEMEGPDAFPEIDWKAYRGMGNFLRHSYHRVSDEIVWNTVQDDLPMLKRVVERALNGPGPLVEDKKPDFE
jgi:uncharacterized protein with HEPN domain